MRLSCNYDELLSNLVSVAMVADDPLSGDEMRNIIFRLEKDSLTLIGVNQAIVFRRPLPAGSYVVDIDSEMEYMQLKCKELLSFLNAYKNLRRTFVNELVFERCQDPQKVRLRVVEMEIPEGMSVEDARGRAAELGLRSTVSDRVFQDIVIKPALQGYLNLTAPGDGLEGVSKEALLFHTRNLLPVMQNTSNLYGNLMMDAGYVVAFNAAYTAVMRNQLKGVFSGVKLSYRVVQFVDRVICSEDDIMVARTDRHIYFRTGRSEAFVIYDSKLAEYKAYVDMYKTDHGIKLDRIYLKDVLKRFSLENEGIIVEVAGGRMELSNTKFRQEIPVLLEKSMSEFGKIRFKIMPETLTKAVIGDDSVFPGELFMYYVPLDNGGAAVTFSDGSGQWFSVARIKTY